MIDCHVTRAPRKPHKRPHEDPVCGRRPSRSTYSIDSWASSGDLASRIQEVRQSWQIHYASQAALAHLGLRPGESPARISKLRCLQQRSSTRHENSAARLQQLRRRPDNVQLSEICGSGNSQKKLFLSCTIKLRTEDQIPYTEVTRTFTASRLEVEPRCLYEHRGRRVRP